MNITLTDLKKIAKMAYIDEKDAMLQLDKIIATLKDVDTLKEIDTTNVEPCIHPSAAYQYMREDEAINSSVIDKLTDIAPLFANGHYLVPNIFAKGE